ncbi:cysteine desulfurase family protein [Bdellovibrio sp. 22V]|uniref:cysteine desulfurase family protein n=1 Tax=Bdellovibrio TaxID=958 RepID=UPI00254332E0|nr:cysteine desulfurase family protein [Bdellovibrio sp. 22V]WII73362.1 cysteine desulfurase family protein [Bdellovibrio sp. 22V]
MELNTERPMGTNLQQDKSIYLDYNATTPVDPRVFQAMEPYFKEHFGNPASAGHHWGWIADNAATKARSQVASLIGAKSLEITFTAGATESNNWAIFGLISKLREENPQTPIHFITSCVEHSSIMKAMAAAEKMGVEVDFLPVNSYGQVEIETVRKAIKPHTKLMSFIWVNNEIGTINPIPELARLAKEHQIYFHTDATQAVGKIPVNVTEMGIDLMSFSGHKIYGPKGIGALYIRSKDPKVQINPLIYGGGQERGLRSGTLNVPAIVGLGVAAEICAQNLNEEKARMTELRDFFWSKLQAAVPGIRLNGHPTERAPNNLNVTLPGHKTEALIARLQKIGVSTGSACGTGAMVISHVLKGIGLSTEEIQCSLRLSLGRWTTQEELERAAEILKNALPH